jgi:hypothetical protein
MFLLHLPFVKKMVSNLLIVSHTDLNVKMRRLLLLLFSACCLHTQAQTEPENPFGESQNFDTTNYSDSFVEVSSVSGPEEPQKPEFKPYERFKSPIDTVTELVTYTGVVPFTPLVNDIYDGGTIDSLYWRAKKFLMQKYIKDYRAGKPAKDLIFPKDMLIEDYKPDGDVGRIIIRATAPVMIKHNSFSSTQNGTVTFRLEIRVKEDKYKYRFTNFVHNTIEKGTEKPIKTYVEFYVNNKRGVKNTDYVLISIDTMVKDMLKDLYKVMKDPVVLDQDDF